METKNNTQHWYHFILLLLLIGISLYHPFLKMTGTTFMQNIIVGLTSVISIRILNFLDFCFFDYGLLFCGIFATITMPFSEIDITNFLIFLLFFGISFWRKELQKGKVLFTWMAFLSYVLNRIFLTLIYQFCMPVYYDITRDITGSSLIKILIFLGLSTLVLILDTALVWALNRLFGNFFQKVSQLELSYPPIARYFILTSIILFILIFFLQYKLFDILYQFSMDHFPSESVAESYSSMVFDLYMSITNSLSVGVIVVQFLILTVLLKFSQYRLTLDAQRRYEEDLLLYNHNLEENLSEIRHLKHDMKNILFTLSHFIENSREEELKEYFQKTVNPYFQKEIKKNDLYTDLQRIEDEQLKAFLYYKLTSGLYDDLDLQFSIIQGFQKELFVHTIEFLDFVRILGIFLDNASEEARNTEEKKVELRLTESKECYEIRVCNSIRSEKKVIPGLSDKGLGRGNGLLIVDNLLKKYPEITLNSYTNKGMFHQSLIIYKQNLSF